MFLAMLYAMVDRYPGEPWWPTNAMLARPLINLALAIFGASIGIFLLGKFLPQSRFFRWIVLAETTPHGSGPMLPEAAAHVLTGASGIAHTTLRPSGKADFAGRLIDVVSQGEFIEAGQAVRVIAVEGQRVVVAASAARPAEGWVKV